MFYLVHVNHDYTESMLSFTSLEAAMEGIQDAFEVEVSPGHPSFADEVDEAYENGNWKGFTLHVIEPATGNLMALCPSKANKALTSNHARLAFEAQLKRQFAQAAA